MSESKTPQGFDNPMASLRLRPAMVQRHTLRPALFPFHGNGYDAAFEVRPPIGRLVAVDQVDTCYLFDRVIQTIGDIIKIIEILHTSFPFVILYFSL